MNILDYIEYWMEQGMSEADAELAASMEFDIWESEEEPHPMRAGRHPAETTPQPAGQGSGTAPQKGGPWMKCNMDCEHCTRPVSKCKGGTYRTAYADAAEKAVNETECLACASCMASANT